MKYQVTVEAVIRKTYSVDAVDDFEAQQMANEMFSVLNEPDVDEHYDQQVIEVKIDGSDAFVKQGE